MCDAMLGSQGQYALTDSYIIKTGFNAAIMRISDVILTYKKCFYEAVYRHTMSNSNERQ